MKLCLLVSRRCNLRCGFCQVKFTDQDMSVEVAVRSIERFFSAVPRTRTPVVKFFGGEPMLNWNVVRMLIEHGRGRWRARGVRYELATNGSVLDAAKASYLASRPEVDTTFSFPAPLGPKIPNVWYTMVLDRDCTPTGSIALLRGLWRAGWRRFNFLPAYFVPWSRPQVDNLRMSLAALSRALIEIHRRDRNVEVKNLKMWSPIPLCNDAVTVDVDGTVYASNVIQLEGLQHSLSALRLGHINDDRLLLEPAVSGDDLRGLLRNWAGPDAWRSTQEVDAALSEFVESLHPKLSLIASRRDATL